MTFETILRDALDDLAGEAVPVPGLAAVALRRARRRRTAARAAVAMAVVVPAAVLASGPADRPATPFAGSETEILPAPEWRELTGAELTAAFAECGTGLAAGGDDSGAWTPARGLRLLDPVPAAAVSTWVVTRSGDQDRVECALTEQSGAVALAARSSSTFQFMTDFDGAAGMGLYDDPVTRVTVQAANGREQDAILWDGYWFYPLTRTSPAARDCGAVAATVRGYDAAGRTVWTSSAAERSGC